MIRQRAAAITLSALMAAALFTGYFLLGERGSAALMQETFDNNLMHTGVRNIVMTVYLNYRLFDTLFEAMLLLICVMGVLQFSKLSARERSYKDISSIKDTHGYSTLMIKGMQGIYIFVFVFGIYIIISGLSSPGGGFQGGGIVAAIVMSIHFSTGNTILTTQKAIVIEKAMFVILLVISTTFLVFGQSFSSLMYRIFLVVINFIIGIKVFCGFIILYLCFMQSGDRLIVSKRSNYGA